MSQNNTLKLKELLTKAIETPEAFRDSPQFYHVLEEDREFIKDELQKIKDDPYTEEALFKLFVAVYLDSIPKQVIDYIKNKKSNRVDRTKNEILHNYLINLAGLLHEAREYLEDQSEYLYPYLMSYTEFLDGTGASTAAELDNDSIKKTYVTILDTAIQKVIHY